MEGWVTRKTFKVKNPEISGRRGSPTVTDQSSYREGCALQGEPKPNPQLEPFKEVIFEMINVKKFKGSRILEEIRSKGYIGGKTTFYSFLSAITVQTQRTYSPYETLPGELTWPPKTDPTIN